MSVTLKLRLNSGQMDMNKVLCFILYYVLQGTEHSLYNFSFCQWLRVVMTLKSHFEFNCDTPKCTSSEGNRHKSLWHWIWPCILICDTKTMSNTRKIDELDVIKMKNFCTKDIIKKVKIQSTKWNKIICKAYLISLSIQIIQRTSI